MAGILRSGLQARVVSCARFEGFDEVAKNGEKPFYINAVKP